MGQGEGEKKRLVESFLQRLTDEVGQVVVGQQVMEAEATVKAPAQDEVVSLREIPEPDSEVMAVSIDGVRSGLPGSYPETCLRP